MYIHSVYKYFCMIVLSCNCRLVRCWLGQEINKLINLKIPQKDRLCCIKCRVTSVFCQHNLIDKIIQKDTIKVECESFSLITCSVEKTEKKLTAFSRLLHPSMRRGDSS